MTKDFCNILKEKISEDIPLTNHMGISINYYDGIELRLTASLEKNINHRQTAFGGSITCLATLACWGFIYLKLYELDVPARIVIQNSTTNYLKPITSNFEAVCRNNDLKIFNRFIDMLKKKSVSRIELSSVVNCENKVAAEFSGVFVAKRY